MKRILLLIVLVYSINGFSQRQMIGLRGGYNYNMNEMSGTGEWRPGQCFHIGATYWYQPKKFYAFGIDLFYEKRAQGNINDAVKEDQDGNLVGDAAHASYY